MGPPCAVATRHAQPPSKAARKPPLRVTWALPGGTERRALRVPVRTDNHGLQRRFPTPVPEAAPGETAGHRARTAQASSLPKLRARVRISSPAPETNPRSATWGLFVVQTIPALRALRVP
jgi:hypothetical protein